MKPWALLDRAQTLFMGFYTHRDFPLEINGTNQEVCFLFLASDIRCIDFKTFIKKASYFLSGNIIVALHLGYSVCGAGSSARMLLSSRPHPPTAAHVRKPALRIVCEVELQCGLYSRSSFVSALEGTDLLDTWESVLSFPCTLSSLLREGPAL